MVLTARPCWAIGSRVMRARDGMLVRFWLVLAVGLGLLVSCSDPAQPSSLPSDAPGATGSSASPSVTVSATPEDEVEAAVRAYYAELTRAAQTNDTSELRAMTTTVCPCYRPVRVIERNQAMGRRTPDASFQLAKVRIHDLEGRSALAEVKTIEEAYKVLGESNRVVGRVPARRHLLDLTLVQDDTERWIIANEFNLGGNQ